jgi:K+-transporting ATPase c subunit
MPQVTHETASTRCSSKRAASLTAQAECSMAEWMSPAGSQLVTENTAGRLSGLFGEPRVNVLVLNLALDATASK